MVDNAVPQNKLDEFIKRARQAAGANLESAILYGSAVSGDYHPDHSNLNLLCILRDTSFSALQALAPLSKWWDSQKQPPPLFMNHSELASSSDVFPIELMDMLQHHRILFGENVLAGLQVSPQLHRTQVEYELREKLILLRQHVTLASEDDRRLRELLLRSVSSIVTLFRHAHIALGNPPLPKRDAVQALSKQLKFDPSAINQALDIREKRLDAGKLNIKDLFSRYLAAVEQVIAAVDQAVY